MGAQGTVEVDFGAFPGASDASVAVTGQSGITAGSLVEAWVYPKDTTDHSADEHILETIKVAAHSIVAGTGFTVTAVNTSQLNEPLTTVGGGRAAVTTLGAMNGSLPIPSEGGRGTRLYGKFTIGWVWN